LKRSLFILSAVLVSATFARADTLWIGSGTGAIPYEGAKIVKIENGIIYFQTRDGHDSSRELSKVQKIAVDDDPSLTAAETAFTTGKWDEAVDGYLKAMQSSGQLWVRDWASARLKEAASKSGRFDALASAQIQQILKDPNAAKTKLQMPGPQSTYLDTAISEVSNTLAQPGLTDAQKMGLLTFHSDMYHGKNDDASADKVAAQIDEFLAKDPNNPAAAGAVTRRKLQLAEKALEAKDYQKALDDLNSIRSSLTDPQQQADALFDIAEAQFGLASVSKNTDALKDAGLAYMRVVAHFKDEPGKPHVAESLLKTGAVYEALGDAKTAQMVYEQVASQYKDDPAAKVASENLARLRPR
jgi:TolA-binding protein